MSPDLPGTIPGGIPRPHRLAKEALDRSLAGLLLLLASIWLTVAAVAVRLDSPGPVFSRERRLGRHGRAFWLLTFRTTVLDLAPAGEGSHAPDGQARVRVPTRVGRVLERCYLDELPKLLNVLRGDMSLVGPPPQDPWAATAGAANSSDPLPVKPGLTGLYQGRLRSGAPHARPMHVADYVRHYSIGLDLAILGRALRAGRAADDAR